PAPGTPMTIRLKLWNHPRDAQFDRIYVTGLAVQGKVYFYRALGGPTLLETEQPGDTERALADVLDALGLRQLLGSKGLWSALCDRCAASRPKAAVASYDPRVRTVAPAPDA